MSTFTSLFNLAGPDLIVIFFIVLLLLGGKVRDGARRLGDSIRKPAEEEQELPDHPPVICAAEIRRQWFHRIWWPM
jgi:hypothetical protein